MFANDDIAMPAFIQDRKTLQFGKGTVQKLAALTLAAGLTAPLWSFDSVAQTKQTTYGSAASLTASMRAKGAVDTRPASKTLRAGLAALDRNRMSQALAARAKLRPGTLERKVLAWAIAIKGSGVGAAELSKIYQDLSHWPGSSIMRRNIERALVQEAGGDALRIAFSQAMPESESARIALAKAHLAAGDRKAARAVIKDLWQNETLSTSLERSILRQFSSVLTRADHRARVEYLLSRRRIRGAERVASLAGAKRLVAARAAVERKQKSASKALAKVTARQRSDANYLFSRARYLRRKGQLTKAAATLMKAKRVHPNFGDAYWSEQRILASDLLEIGKARLAYRVVKRNFAASARKKVDAEFYAGWLALRKNRDTKTARRHFKTLLSLAKTPLSRSRGHYWMARAYRQAGNSKAAANHFATAARYDTTFYGQLALLRSGGKSISVSRPRPTRTDRAQLPQYELVQAISKLESAGHPRRARMIYRFLAQHLNKPGKLAILAARAERRGDYQLSLQIGKRAFVRGFNVDSLAWPIGAIPTNQKTSGAGLPLAYAIARQESTFQVDARSPANALGLLQLLPSTAKRTARSLGLKYSRRRLVTDAGYNARLGTAFFAQQLQQFGGSYVLTLAAYNAGPRRSKEWVQRFGDPRGKSLDYVVDWIEQIPFAETRGYVQRVLENYQVYKARLKGGRLTLDRDLRAGRSG